MKSIYFKEDTELEVITEYNEATDNIADSHKTVFKAGERIPDVQILESDSPEWADIQFANGDLALTIQREYFEEVEKD